ncbi:MAG TPA: hypothetical protein VEX88_05290 [Glaciibacter sp.]|nr:hypothetical protein [Glaciibacter sp.]
MDSPQIPAVAAPGRAWFVGGALLLATVPLGVATHSTGAAIVGANTITTVLFSASLLVFAFGIRGSGSITARRPLGTTALAVLAIWALLGWVLTDVVGASAPYDERSAAMLMFGYVDTFVELAVALVAVVQIARAGVVPSPWNWAPAWALLAMTVPWLVWQIIAAGATQETASTAIFFISGVGGFVDVGSTIFLGVLAIVLSDRLSRTEAVSLHSISDRPHEPAA